MLVVIPSNREIKLEYFTPLIDSGARFIIVDDSEGSIHINHPNFKTFSQAPTSSRMLFNLSSSCFQVFR